MPVILITTLFYKALILQREIWCWSLLGFKRLTEFALHRDKDTDIFATSGQWICFGTSVSKSHYRLSEWSWRDTQEKGMWAIYFVNKEFSFYRDCGEGEKCKKNQFPNWVVYLFWSPCVQFCHSLSIFCIRLACVASVFARVPRVRRKESKKKKILLLPLKLSRNDSIGNACYAG